MEEDRAANQRSVFSLSFTLALYISIGFDVNIFEIQPSKVKRWSFKTYVFLNSELKLETNCEVSETIKNGIEKSNFLRGKMFPK